MKPTIRRVTPVNGGLHGVVIEFQDGSMKCIDRSVLWKEFPEKQEEGARLPYRAFPLGLLAYSYSERELFWKDGVCLSLDEVHTMARDATGAELEGSTLSLGGKDKVLTRRDRVPGFYHLWLRPFSLLSYGSQAHLFGMSISEGFGPWDGNGGSWTMSLETALSGRAFERTGCDWALDLAREHASDLDSLIEQLCRHIREKHLSGAPVVVY